MNYPLISEYIESIMSAEDNFDELSYLRPVLGEDGLPVMTSGNFAVVFKMKDERDGKLYAVKCFTKEQEGRAEAYREIAKELKDFSSTYLVSIQFLEKELFVDTDQTTETEFPVLLMDWVEGKTLDKYLRENLDDKYALEMLAYRFSQLAQWLIPQPFAHGDLKPDNILVREDGSLVLVDYDGMYVPAMKGQKARELGSPDFRHPLRTENDFDEHIDDFPLVSILLSLKCISLDSQLLEKYGAKDRLLFSERDYRDVSQSRVIKELYPSYDNFINKLIDFFKMLLERISHYRNLSSFNRYKQLSLKEPLLHKIEETDISMDEWNHCLIYNHLAIGLEKYSADKTKLLLFGDTQIYGYAGDYYEESVEKYTIRTGTIIICNRAFSNNKALHKVVIPGTVELIGENAFENCDFTYIELPSSIRYIDKNAFLNCRFLKSIIVPKGSISRFANMLPNNIPQLTEVDVLQTKGNVKDIIEKACVQLRCSPFELLKLLFKKESELNTIIGYEDATFHKYECDCFIDLKLPVEYFPFADRRHYKIGNIENAQEIADFIIDVIIDLGHVELIQDINDYLNVHFRGISIYTILTNFTKKAIANK